MKRGFSFLGISLLATAVGMLACRHQPLFDTGTVLPPNTSTTPCSPDTAYFVNDVMPIITSNCSMAGCHDNISAKEGVRLTSYNGVRAIVSPGNATGSDLYKEIIKASGGRMPPPPMPSLTASQKLIIQKWINQGAKNNACASRCDTTSFTFSGAIKPLMDNRCVGCHNPTNLGGNIDLSAYAAVKAVALNGKLLGSIKQQAGYSAMPKNGYKLSDCEITQVSKWIAAGTLNN
jgi:uncharacterized membrane protein